MTRRGPSTDRDHRLAGHRVRILVVDRSTREAAGLYETLRSQGWQVITALLGAEAIQKARDEGPDAIVTELKLADMDAPDLCRALRERAETASTPVIVYSTSAGVAERVACLRAGASDYLVRPANPQEIITRLQTILDLRQEKAALVVAVVGSKGGVGTSVLACNTAVALKRRMHADVIILDAATHGGAVDVMLNVQAVPGAGQLLTRQTGELEPADLESLFVSHASGLRVMSLRGEDPEPIAADALWRVLVALRRLCDLVVIDTWPVLDENTATILELADRVLLVLTPEITSLRGARLLLEHMEATGLARERIVPVLNRYPQRGALQQQAIENALGMSIGATIPDDPKLVTYSVNRGVPLRESHQRSAVARQLDLLASGLLEDARHTERTEGVEWALHCSLQS